MADDILKNIPLPADLPENWTSQQTVAPTGAEVGMDEQHGYNYLMKQVNNAQKAATALNEGKLDLTGGTMTGELIFGNISGKIYSGPNDAAYGPEEGLSNLVIESWNGISFAAASSEQVYYKKTAVGIDCRNSVVKARRFEGVADNGIVASGDNYVRFGDGTQICWGLVRLNGVITESKVRVTYPLAFSEIPRVFSTLSANVGIDILIGIGWETNTSFSIGTSGPDSTGATNWLAIGRWK